MSRPLVLLDCDGILSDFVGHLLNHVDWYLDRRYNRDDVKEFDFSNLPGWSAIASQAWDLCREPGFCFNMPLIEGSQAGVQRLREIANVEICTSPMHGAATWTGERDEWLRRHFGFDHTDVHHVRKKYRLTADMLVDDSGQNIAEWSAGRPGGLLWDRSYNRHYSGTRVHSWDDVIEAVKAL